jgi:mersacidin/lichenicidin family type 2 lantibiotic
MSTIDVIRAWKDEEYRNSLTPDQQAALPDNPAGMVELDDEALDFSGAKTEHMKTNGCCGGYTNEKTCFSLTCGTCYSPAYGTCGVFSIGCC